MLHCSRYPHIQGPWKLLDRTNRTFGHWLLLPLSPILFHNMEISASTWPKARCTVTLGEGGIFSYSCSSNVLSLPPTALQGYLVRKCPSFICKPIPLIHHETEIRQTGLIKLRADITAVECGKQRERGQVGWGGNARILPHPTPDASTCCESSRRCFSCCSSSGGSF